MPPLRVEGDTPCRAGPSPDHTQARSPAPLGRTGLAHIGEDDVLEAHRLHGPGGVEDRRVGADEEGALAPDGRGLDDIDKSLLAERSDEDDMGDDESEGPSPDESDVEMD